MKKTAYILVSCRNSSKEGFSLYCDDISFDRKVVYADMETEYKKTLKEFSDMYGEDHLNAKISRYEAHIYVESYPEDSCGWKIFERAVN